jgi:predicted NUDIX family phosphoesterase
LAVHSYHSLLSIMSGPPSNAVGMQFSIVIRNIGSSVMRGSRMVSPSEEVLVCRREALPDLPGRGLLRDRRLMAWLSGRGEFLSREKAETDPRYKQIIPYSLLRWESMVFRYRRSVQTGEHRLHNLYSIGVGGHVNRQDVSQHDEDIEELITTARDRETREEFAFVENGRPKLIGLLNDDMNEVGRVHLGIVYEYALSSSKVRPLEGKTHIECGFVSVNDLSIQREEYETWSQIIIESYIADSQLWEA